MCCTVKDKRQSQDNKDKEVRMKYREQKIIPGGGEIFRTSPDRPWGPTSLVYNVYLVTFPGVKQAGRGVNHPPSPSAEVKERVELYLYSPSGSSWPILG